MKNISRRNFLKGAGASVSSLAFSSFIPQQILAKEGESHTVLTAAHWGAMQVDAKNGMIVSSKGALPQTIPNSLQSTAADQAYTKARVQYPSVRKGFLSNPGKPDNMRGRDKFVRVTWSEALKLIHEQQKRIREEYGHDSVFAGSYGWRSSGVLHKPQTLLQRYMSMAGGYSAHIGDYSTGAAQVIMPHVVGSIEVYEQQTTHPVVLDNSEVVVLWGMNPMNTLKVSWTCTDETGLEFFRRLKESGKNVIAIDPIRSETVDFFGDNAQWIAPHAGTDVAMMLGIAYSLVKNKNHDRAFLEKYTTGYKRFENYLLGKSDGTPKTTQWASEICGISAGTLESLADLFSNNRTMLMAGWGMQRQQYGEQKHWMLVTLAAMLGQIGLKGGGFGFSYHYSNGGNPTRDAGILPSVSNTVVTGGVAELARPVYGALRRFPVARIVEALENPNGKYQHNGETKTFPDIKMIWWAGGNNFAHHPDTNRLVKAWQKPEMIVVSDPYWTPSAKHADIILPITTSFERNDLTMTGYYSNQHIVPMKQVIAPQFEARNDFDVFADMAELLKPGGREIYTEGKTEMKWLKNLYDVAQEAGRLKRVRMPRFNQFWNENKLVEMKFNEKNAGFVRYADFRNDPAIHPLGTPSGKIEICSRVIESFNYDDCPPHPSWIPPKEWIGLANKEELQLMSPHPAHRLHSQLNYATLREKYAIANCEPVTINYYDAKLRGISTGDLVRVYNKRGEILAGAFVTDGIRKGAVCIHEGGWPDFDPAHGICKNGAVNVLTEDLPSSRLANGCAPCSALVKIEKYTKDKPELTAFTPPAME